MQLLGALGLPALSVGIPEFSEGLLAVDADLQVERLWPETSRAFRVETPWFRYIGDLLIHERPFRAHLVFELLRPFGDLAVDVVEA